ncbi:MAG: hypothetical protein WA081_05005, partial [Desulfosalsimonadaceae bacterium]
MCVGSNPKDRIRVGFIINYDFDIWLGGFNYYKTLVETIMDLPEREIEPVIFTGRKNLQRVSETFPKNDIIVSDLMDKWSAAWIMRSIMKRVVKCDGLLKGLLKNRKIALLSHAGLTDSYSGLPSLCWIPDFQHRHLPQFFSSDEIARRDRRYMKLCRISKGVILSSLDAQKDLAQFCPQGAAKSFVLNFVPRPGDGYDRVSLQELRKKYQIPFSYFHVPNQFWAHKNHRLIIDALRILKQEGKMVYIVATGNPLDDRQPDFYANLMNQVERDGLADFFKPLGVV